MNRLSLIIIIILLAIIAGQQAYISIHECNKDCPVIATSIDSNTTVKIDTIMPDVKETEHVNHNPKPTKSYPVPQDNNDTVSIANKSLCDTINIYEDSLITPYANAYSIDTIQGKKLGGKISILQKGPLKIIETKTNNITITNTVTDTIKVSMPTSWLYAGVGVSGTFVNGFKIADIKPELAFISKKGNSYEYGYGLFTQRHEVTFKKVIFKSK
jgi:hypothetical protein